MTKKLELNDSKNNSQANEEELDITHIYTKLSEAKEEVWRRWNDKELRKKVEEFLGDEMPDVFKDGPKAVLFRFLATPNFEFRLFSDMNSDMGLEVVFFEFLKDKFCTRNQDKVHLGKLKFYERINGSEAIIKQNRILDLQKCEGEMMCNVVTDWGENLIDFHHRIFFKNHNAELFDVSNFKKNGESAGEVYEKVFSLFICFGVLYENYFVKTSKEEYCFVDNVIKPSFEKVKNHFNIKPLIVPLIGPDVEGDLFWQFYPEEIKNDLIIKK